MWLKGNSCSSPKNKGEKVLLKKKGQIQRFVVKKKKKKESIGGNN